MEGDSDGIVDFQCVEFGSNDSSDYGDEEGN